MHGRSRKLLAEVVGQRFGTLVIGDYAGVNEHGDLLVNAACDCGRKFIKRAWYVKAGERCSRECPIRAKEAELRRFNKKVRRGDASSCWEWAGYVDSQTGYGRFKRSTEKTMNGAHRAAFELFIGPIPEDRQIDHLCRNRACVNPNHLEAVTQQENIRRGATARQLESEEEKLGFVTLTEQHQSPIESPELAEVTV